MLKKFSVLFHISFVIVSLQAQNDHYNFGHLVYSDGLSHNNVLCFAEDNNGFMWVGTKNGLNRFDGYNFKIFTHTPEDSNSLPDNYVREIVKDQLGRLWVRLTNSVSILNPNTENFNNKLNLSSDTNFFNLQNISKIVPYGDSNLVFRVDGFGVVFHNIYTNKNKYLTHSAKNEEGIATNYIADILVHGKSLYLIHRNGVIETINTETQKVINRNFAIYKLMDKAKHEYEIFCDSENNLWLFCRESPIGLVKISNSGKLKIYNTQTSPALNSNIVSDLIEDSNKNIWIGTDHGGINILYKDNEKIEYLTHNQYNENSLSQNVVTKLYISSDSVIWVGTFKQGISYYHKNLFRFFLYANHKNDLSSLPYNDVNCFAEDKTGNLWIGTNGKGLIYFDRKNNSFTSYSSEAYTNKGLKSDVIVSLHVDEENKLWVGTYHGGLSIFDGERFETYMHDPTNPKSIEDNKVWEIFEDSSGNIWIGMLGGGLNMFDKKTSTFYSYTGKGLNSINSSFVMDITEDKEGNIWFGTDNGLFALDKRSSRFIHYTPQDGKNGLSNLFVYNVFCDSKGNIWAGTRYGLNLLIKGTTEFIKFDKTNGLADNSILSILESDFGNLWLGTSNGLTKLKVRYDKKGSYLEHDAINFNETDGLQGREFNEGSALKTSRGELIFGGSNGFNLFKPQNEHINSEQSATHIIGLEIFGNKIEVNKPHNNREIIRKTILDNELIELYDKEKMYSLEWVNINFLGRKDINYRYKLEGFNDNWIYTDWDNRNATFTNLNPGKYVFTVQASDYQTEWSESECSVSIKINPPWFKTTLAYSVYILILTLITIIARKTLLEKERNKLKQQQAVQESERQHELNVLKTRFFTNVSHEFRTPLSLIITPLERLLNGEINNDSKKHLELIYQNARRLLTLVNQLLDFRKAEESKLKLNLIYGNIVNFIRQTIESFSDLKETKHIDLDFIPYNKELFMQFDKDKVDKIIINLLSNAFKFTPENGNIKVITKLVNENMSQYFRITVEDSGIGIPEEEQDKIFDRFYQTELPSQFLRKGSGIGLSLTKDFVELQNGSIRVESEVGKGSKFIIMLPVNSQKLKETANISEKEEHLYAESEQENIPEPKDSAKKTILLVEDNFEFRSYIKDSLMEKYLILEAENGKQALSVLDNKHLDLIVSDVMMPEMDGLELCNEIKQNPNYSHIPIILLTARSAQQDKLDGLKVGADEYITKPFNFEILEKRVEYLLKLRQKFINRYQRSFEIETESQLTAIDEKFLKKTYEIINDNIGKTDLSVESLSKELGMSRVNLYKKLTSLTGKPPVEFIRLVKLKKGAELLLKGQLTVSEIAYEIGFSDPRYFSKLFKTEYGIQPSKYKDENTSNMK